MHSSLSIILLFSLLINFLQFPNLRLTQAPNMQEETRLPLQTGLIVRLKADVRLQDIQPDLIKSGVETLIPLAGQEHLPIYRAVLAPRTDAMTARLKLALLPWVDYAELDHQAQAAMTPNDPEFDEQWGLEKINAPMVWDAVTGSPSVIIAVIDSGIDLDHPDLADQLWTNPGEIENGLDDDANGKVDDLHGWNFLNADHDLWDANGHGTQVTGVIGAVGNNGQGIAGLCWGCKIMPLRVMSAGGVSNYSDIVAAIYYAADKGASVINISLGGYYDSKALKDAISYAQNIKDVVVVAGAGNDHVATRFYPAAYPGVLAVAATTPADTLSDFSNYGDWVDLTAPGEDIRTTFLGGDYGPGSGTSISSPFVSGLAGLIRSRWGSWSQAMVTNQILHTADSIAESNPELGSLIGAGRINAAAALQEPHPILALDSAAVNGDPAGRPTPGQTATLQVSLRNDWWDASSVQAILSTSDPKVSISGNTATYGNILSGSTAGGEFSFSPSADIGYNHPIPFHLEVSADGGAYTASHDFTITVRSGDEPFCGTITESTTWTRDKTYVITCDVWVAEGAVLTIEPGTVVNFMGNYSLNVLGALIADGTASQPIQFLGNQSGNWGAIFFDDPSTDAVTNESGEYQAGNILRWVTIRGADQGIQCAHSTPFLDHVSTNRGGMNCQLGDTVFWGTNNTITGDIAIQGIPITFRYPWEEIAPLPVFLNGHGAASSNGRVYSIGGNMGYPHSPFPLPNVDEYDPITNSWSGRAPLLFARTSFGITSSTNGHIYAAGGRGDSGILSSFEEYDPSTDIWTIRAPMLTPRTEFGLATAASGKIYAIGGRSDSFTSSIEEYDPISDSWQFKSAIPTPRIHLGVMAAPDGKIYAMGGYASAEAVATVEAYDPLTDTWSTCAPMPTPRAEFGITLLNGKIYVIGGVNQGNGLKTMDEYDPVTDTWVSRESMLSNRVSFATTTADGKIYVLGGEGMSFGSSAKVETYSPPTEHTPFGINLISSTVIGSVDLFDFSQVILSRITGSLNLQKSSQVMDTTASASISLGENGVAKGNTSTGLSLQSNGFAENNTVNGPLSTGENSVIEYNRVTDGSISAGKGSKIHNSTISRGGILATGPADIAANDIESAPEWGIQVTGSEAAAILSNRLVGNANGIKTAAGIIQGNLVANSAGVGIEIGSATVSNNTLISNGGSAIKITSGSPASIDHNNFEFNTGTYDIENLVPKGTLATVPAQNNWWGTSDNNQIKARIFDFNRNATLGTVLYSPKLAGPDQNAPAYVRSVNLDPLSPVGIQPVTFTTQFSKPMDTSDYPRVGFHSILANSLKNITNIPTPRHYLGVVTASDGQIYTIGGHTISEQTAKVEAYNPDTNTWTTKADLHHPRSSLLVIATSNGKIYALGGNTYDTTIEEYDILTNTWLTKTSKPISLTYFDAAAAVNGLIYVIGGNTTTGDVGIVEEYNPITNTWTQKTGMSTPRSGFAFVAANNGRIYAMGGNPHPKTVEEYDPITDTWSAKKDMLLPRGHGSIVASSNGIVYAIEAANTIVEEYHPETDTWLLVNSSLTISRGGYGVAAGTNGAIYIIGGFSPGNFRDVGEVEEYKPSDWGAGIVSETQVWFNPSQYRAKYEFTTLNPRGDYIPTVSGVRGSDGMEIAPYTGPAFTVYYAGYISDVTAPPAPSVSACSSSQPGTISAAWHASDPQSEITLYRYAIGTKPGGTEVTSWSSLPGTSMTRSSLGLTLGQTYYVSVQARNVGGLWSDYGTSTISAGTGGCSLTGTITDENGQPLAGVSVWAGPASTVTTNENGQYRFGALPPGQYIVSPVLTGYTFSPASRNITLPDTGTSLDFIATTVKTLAISGRIANSSGDGIAGVTVSDGTGSVSTTNANGDYSLTNLTAGTYTITPVKAGYAFNPPNRSVSLTNTNQTGIDYVGTVLTGNLTISGRVTDGAGNPLSGVIISAGSGISTLTDTSGNYSLSFLEAGDYIIAPAKEGYIFQPASRAVNLTNRSVSEQNFSGYLAGSSVFLPMMKK